LPRRDLRNRIPDLYREDTRHLLGVYLTHPTLTLTYLPSTTTITIGKLCMPRSACHCSTACP
jgi:hypothetical protein